MTILNVDLSAVEWIALRKAIRIALDTDIPQADYAVLTNLLDKLEFINLTKKEGAVAPSIKSIWR